MYTCDKVRAAALFRYIDHMINGGDVWAVPNIFVLSQAIISKYDEKTFSYNTNLKNENNFFFQIFCRFDFTPSLRQHYRDHLRIQYICGYCSFQNRLRKPVLCHIWEKHPKKIEQIDSTNIAKLFTAQICGKKIVLKDYKKKN